MQLEPPPDLSLDPRGLHRGGAFSGNTRGRQFGRAQIPRSQKLIAAQPPRIAAPTQAAWKHAACLSYVRPPIQIWSTFS